jgi:hypothetical protein
MNPSKTDSPSVEMACGALRFSNGAQVEPGPGPVAQPAPAGAHSGREGEQLFFLLRLSPGASLDVYEALRAEATDTFWATSGSTMAALRKAAIAVNRRLTQLNSGVARSARLLGDLACAVLHDDDLFLLEAGQVSASFLHRGRLQKLAGGQAAAPIGAGQVADVRVNHAFSAPGDTLLLAAPSLTPLVGTEPLHRVLADADLPSLLSRLAQTAAESDFTALVARRKAGSQVVDVPSTADAAEAGGAAVPAGTVSEAPARPRRPRARPAVRRPSRIRLWARQALPRIRAALSSGIESARRGLSSAGARLGRAAKTLLRRTLPGPERTARPPSRPEPAYPEERRGLMRGIAIGIPAVLAVLVALAYISFGADARFQRQLQQAQQQIDLAAAAADPDEARSHLELALDYASRAVDLRREDPDARRLEAEAQRALDVMEHVVRLNAVQVWDAAQGTWPSRLIVRGQMLFVLNSQGDPDWVIRLDLSSAGDSLATGTSVTEVAEEGQIVALVPTDGLVDCAWVDTAGGRGTSGLVVLDESGGLLTYDPSGSGEGVVGRVTRSTLRDVLAETALAVDTYQGRFYLLDPIRNQIWRYAPEGDSYPYPPEPYFSSSPAKHLSSAVDMAINGSVYVLYEDGTLLRFDGGEGQRLDPEGMAGDLSEATAIALDPSGMTGWVYVADPGGGRVVVLAADGAFVADYRMQEEVPLDRLSALAVDETAGRLYFVSGQYLYSAPLP